LLILRLVEGRDQLDEGFEVQIVEIRSLRRWFLFLAGVHPNLLLVARVVVEERVQLLLANIVQLDQLDRKMYKVLKLISSHLVRKIADKILQN
jgi:hypothetical protein